MGVRLYNPTLGRYLQTDPVYGGSANAYDYVNQDPVNADDLTGEASYSNMNSSEKNRCWAHPLQCITYGYVATIASLFGEHYKGGVRNAMRHCAFSALLSYFFSSGTAQAWEAAHEGTLHDIVGNKTGRQRQNAWNDHLIDLQNNVVGNRIGREVGSMSFFDLWIWGDGPINAVCDDCRSALAHHQLNTSSLYN